ncbi:FAD-dependent oxidoreductase [Ferrovibrio terrae]|uniref:dihydrolipoyl dehydrogenase family protein n=1 Tax=Ferrovibrio terrae TaxID=2594003 RepID=UPI003137DC0D
MPSRSLDFARPAVFAGGMTERIECDIAVVGAGTAGITVAAGGALLGAKTVLIERDRMGGARLYGELPLQALAAAARHATDWQHAAKLGIRFDEPDIDILAVLRHANATIAAAAPNDSAERLGALGVTVLQGEARFAAPDTLNVGSTQVTARRFVIASGAKPAMPAIPGLTDIACLTPQSIFDLTERPLHLLVIGGGGTGIACAQAFQRLGVRVTLVERQQCLARHDPELRDLVVDALRRDGVTLHEQTTITLAENSATGIVLTLHHADGGTDRIAGSHLLLATGWQADLDALDLRQAGITTGPRGIAVDGTLRTSNHHVHAIGAAVDPQATTAIAVHHATVALKNILLRLPLRADRRAAADLVACDPELACVGLSEAAARARHGRIHIQRRPFILNERALAEGRSEGLLKVMTTSTGRILGAAAVGPQAAEILHPWALAIGKGLGIGAVQAMIAPFPARGSSALQAAADFYRPKLFSPLTRRIVQFLARFG